MNEVIANLVLKEPRCYRPKEKVSVHASPKKVKKKVSKKGSFGC